MPGPHLLLIEPFLGSSPPFFDTMKHVWVKRIYSERDPSSLERTEDPLTGALLDLGRFGFSLSPTPQTRAPKYQAILPVDPGPSRIAPNCQGSFFLGRGWSLHPSAHAYFAMMVIIMTTIVIVIITTIILFSVLSFVLCLNILEVRICTYVCMYVYIYIHTDRQTDMHSYIRTHTRTSVHPPMHAYIYIHTYIHRCTHTHKVREGHV